MTIAVGRPPVGVMLREWRCRRRLSQLELALAADVSSRHLSFLETGRSRPSAEMVLRLAERLDVPLRERNDLLLAAGYAPAYWQRELNAHEMRPVRGAIERVLGGHEPYPSVVVDRHWDLVSANCALAVLVEGAAPHLLEPPVNLLRLSLHPEGIAPRIINLPQWRTHLLQRLQRDALAAGDPALNALHDELASYPSNPGQPLDPALAEVAVPLRVRARGAELSFISTRTSFGSALDVTVGELSIESFFPTDERTADAMQAAAQDTRRGASAPQGTSVGEKPPPSPQSQDGCRLESDLATTQERQGADMATDNAQRSVLLIGKSQLVLDESVAGLRELGYRAEATNDFSDIIGRFEVKAIDLVVFGGQVPPDRKAELREEIGAINPGVIFVQGLAGIPGLIINQVLGAFAASHQDRAPTYTPDDRSIRLTLPGPADVKVTVWWQTAFVPPDPKSDSLLLLDDRLAGGDHPIPVPDQVPSEAAFATVEIDAAIYAFSIARER